MRKLDKQAKGFYEQIIETNDKIAEEEQRGNKTPIFSSSKRAKIKGSIKTTPYRTPSKREMELQKYEML